MLTAPCWFGCGGLFIRAQYIHWFVYTAEDREFMRSRRELGYDEGIPSVARRLKAEMAEIADPETAIARHPDWFIVRCADGEWVFGHGIDSHGFAPGHGTLVMKDCRGQTRIFFGHVCGPNAEIEWFASTRKLKTPSDVYDMLKELDPRFREWNPDQ